MCRNVFIVGLGVLFLGGLGVQLSRACTVPIASPFEGEQSHPQIFSRLLGETMDWAPKNIWGTQDLIGPTYRVTRIDESDPTLAFGMVDADRVWSNVVFQATAVGAFGRYAHTFGYKPVGSSGWVDLFNATGTRYDATGSSAIVDLTGVDFTWIRRGDGNPYSSLEDDNLDTMDHLLTYRLDPLTPPGTPPTRITYFLFWEDLHRRGTSPIDEWPADDDFNDLVVRIDVILPGDAAYPIPEPSTALGVGGLLLAGLSRRRRRQP